MTSDEANDEVRSVRSGSGRLILVRHGESEGNQARRFSVTSDIGLTPLGEEQAREAGRRIAAAYAPLVIVASPFRRARLTAGLIAGELRHRGEIRIEDDLCERSIGELAGEPYDAMRRHPSFDAQRFWEWRPPGGESLVDVGARASRVLESIAAAHPSSDVVVVSHGGVMLALCAHVEGGWFRPRVAANCDLVVVEHRGGAEMRLVPEVGASGPGRGFASRGVGDGRDGDDATG